MHSSTRVTLPAAFEAAEIDNLALLIGISNRLLSPASHLNVFEANMLERLIAHNDKIPLLPYVLFYLVISFIFLSVMPSESLTRFHSRAVPNISVLDYLRRIIKWTKVEVRIQSDITSVPSQLLSCRSHVFSSPYTTSTKSAPACLFSPSPLSPATASS